MEYETLEKILNILPEPTSAEVGLLGIDRTVTYNIKLDLSA